MSVQPAELCQVSTPADLRRALGNITMEPCVKWYGSNIENREKGLPGSILMFVLNHAAVTYHSPGS